MADDKLGFNVLGEFLFYDRLYEDVHAHDRAPRLALLCAKTKEEAIFLCKQAWD
jgi:hypothetical protein